MRKIRDILRLRFECRLTIRQISISFKISTGVITKYLNLFNESGLSWPLPDEMDDTSLINQLTPEAINRRYQGLADPDWIDIHRSLKQKRG